jgi:transcriptional regulator with XRE-family HTH domain
MKKEPIKKDITFSTVNDVPLPDAVRYVTEGKEGITEEEMAGKLGISPELLRAYLRGERPPPDDLSSRLLKAYRLRIVQGEAIGYYKSRTKAPPPPPLE